MKSILLTAGMVLACAANAMAADIIEKSALLRLPETVIAWSPLDVDVTFRWDDDPPLKITTWALKKGMSIEGEIQFFDATGNRVGMINPSPMVSPPSIPKNERIIIKGEVVKLGLYYVGYPLFQRSGDYYAIATFSSILSDGTTVRFTTKKRWIKVSVSPPN